VFLNLSADAVEYKKSNVDNWKTEVTEILQRRVVDEFLEEAKASGIYANQAEGIL
jgi:hypothetical protein